MKWQLHTPARLELIAPSGGGKSTLLLKLVEDDSVWDKPFGLVIYCAPLLSDRDDYLEKLAKACGEDKLLTTLDRVPTLDDIQNQSHTEKEALLILDDLLGFKDSKDAIQDLMTMHSHHYNLSVVFTVQNPFLKTKHLDLTTMSRNLTGRILLFQLNDYYLYKLLNSRLFPEHKLFVIKCLNEAKDKYGCPYIFINLHSFSDIPRRYICYTGLFQEERAHYGDSPVFFDLQQS